MGNKYTRDEIKNAIWQELKESEHTGDNNDQAYEIIGVVMAGLDGVDAKPVAALTLPTDYPGSSYQNLFNYLHEEHGLTLLQGQMDDLINVVHKLHPAGAALPADDAVQNWFEENIDKECSASSAVYKFRLWLESLQVVRQAGAEWVKASERTPSGHSSDYHWRFIHNKKPINRNFHIESGRLIQEYGNTKGSYSLEELEWLDEQATPAAAREEDAVTIFEELWDEHAEYIDDDIDSLSRWAGSTVVDKEQFKTVVAKMWELFKQQRGNP